MENNQVFPNGFGYRSSKDLPGYKSEVERQRESQKQTINALKDSPFAARLQHSVPVESDEYGIPIIENAPKMPDIDPSVFNQQPKIPVNELNAMLGQRDVPQQQAKTMDVSTFFNAAPNSQERPQSNPMQNNPNTQNTQNAQSAQSRQPLPSNVPKKENLSYHPVIQKMLKNFGLKKDKKEYLEIFVEGSDEKTVYTMVEVTEELQTWALEAAKEKLGAEGGGTTATVYFELLFVCCSVVAIDGEPVWQVFGIKPFDDEYTRLVNDPLDMPVRLRKLVAKELVNLLWSQMLPIGDKLLTFYQSVILGRKVVSSFDEDVNRKVRFVCPLDGCDHFEFLVPETSKTYFCRNHGVPLVETVDLTKENNIPLA
jgi:hypothetical protein